MNAKRPEQGIYTHPSLLCRHGLLARYAIEYQVPVAGLNPGDTEKRFRLAHDDDACFDELWNSLADQWMTGHYPLTRLEAETISGLDLGQAAA